jgi:hypothetical protein
VELLLVSNGYNCTKCTEADVRLRTPNDGQRLSETCRVATLIKLEFSASIGFIHKKVLGNLEVLPP